MMQMMSLLQNGGNPMAFLQTMAKNNPQIASALRMMQGKSSQQLRQMAENMAKERGVSLNDVARQLGINLPSDR